MDPKLKLAGLVVAAGFLYAGYELYDFLSESAPKMTQDRKVAEAEFANKQSEYQRLRQFVQNIENIKGELRELSLQLKSALEYMPPELRLAELLRKLTGIAQNSGVELVNFSPEPNEQRQEGAFYATANIGFEIRGGFTQCLLFFDQISRLKRIINIVAVSMDAAQGPVGEGRVDRIAATKITASGNVLTFRFAE